MVYEHDSAITLIPITPPITSEDYKWLADGVNIVYHNINTNQGSRYCMKKSIKSIEFLRGN